MRRAEHEKRAAEFRGRLAAIGARPAGERVWPELAEWPTVDATATCRTPDCPAEGVAFAVRLHVNADGVYRAACGCCNQQHTELYAGYDDGPVNLAPPRAQKPPRPAPGPSMVEGEPGPVAEERA
jgi:hypothetical protein